MAEEKPVIDVVGVTRTVEFGKTNAEINKQLIVQPQSIFLQKQSNSKFSQATS